jgi:YgiT-type zinc finger domain-containing protein
VKAGIVTEFFEGKEGVGAVVIKGVPARVCDQCGERYFDDDVAQRLLKLANEAADAGLELGVRQFVAS